MERCIMVANIMKKMFLLPEIFEPQNEKETLKFDKPILPRQFKHCVQVADHYKLFIPEVYSIGFLISCQGFES